MGELTRIVPHFPVDKLPDELRAGFEARGTVTITMEPEPKQVPPLRSFSEFFSKSGRVHVDPVADIRKLRDEWDD